MTAFLLDTDAVQDAVDSFKEVSKNFYNLSYSVEDYDTSCSEFNFSSVKSLMVSNVKSCAIRTSNTACYINRVITNHTDLQKKEKYSETEPNVPDFDTPTSSSQSVSTPIEISSSTTVIKTTSPPINLYYNPQAAVVSGGQVASVVAATYTPASTNPPEVKEEESTASTTIDVKVENISHEEVDKESLNSAGKYMFNHKDLVYNDAGYAQIGDRYIISCTSDYGVVGDEINIKMKDGSFVKCIIGGINDGESSRINFFVNDQWSENGAGNLPTNFAANISSVNNIGFNEKYSIKPSVSSALDWAYDLAHGNAVGGQYDDYNAANKYGYASFALSSYKSAGVKIDEKEGEDIRDTLHGAGFEKLSNEINVSDLKPGDILIDENDQLKMYYGDGQFLEEYGDVTGASSSFGVRLTDYSDHSWNGVLRYKGDSTITVNDKIGNMSYADVMDMEA